MQNLSFSPEDLAGQERKAKRQDQAAAFASWLNSMSIRPDPNLPAQLQAARAARVENLRKNRTVNMLEQAGQTELANLVKAGTLDAKSAASQMFQLAAEERQFARQKELLDYEKSLTVPKDDRTQRQKDYEYATEVLKLEPQKAMQWAKSGTTVNVGGGDDFTKALMKEQAKRYETYQTAADSARSVMENLDVMNTIVEQDDFYSGFGAETLVRARRAATAFGANPESVKNAETFMKVAKDSALQVMGGSLGVGFSNADREFVEAMVPNITNTIEGNKLIIEVQKRIQDRKIRLAMFAEQYADENKNLSGFTAAVEEWANNNPLFTSQEKQQFFGSDGGAVTGLSENALSFIERK